MHTGKQPVREVLEDDIGLTSLAGSFVVGAFFLLVVGQVTGREVADA